jgi:hypothetical protein
LAVNSVPPSVFLQLAQHFAKEDRRFHRKDDGGEGMIIPIVAVYLV